MKLITATGYGGTGSSAITNILEEFSCVENLGNFEFRFLQDPDGIKDLEYALVLNPNRFNCDIAIKRFEKLIKFLAKKNCWWNNYENFCNQNFYKISMEYLNSLIDIKWDGFWHYYEIDAEYKINWKIKMKLLTNRLIYRFFNKRILKINKEMILSLPNEDFYDKTKIYLNKLFKEINSKNKEFLVLDQLVPALNAEGYLKFFSNIKIIIVDRDPRDLFYINKNIWQETWIPQDVNKFIKWYKKLRENNKSKNENILYIQFEDLIYKYEDKLNEILLFLDIPKERHINKKKYFNPEISIRNTNVFSDCDIEIKKIKKELQKYCYKFENSGENLNLRQKIF